MDEFTANFLRQNGCEQYISAFKGKNTIVLILGMDGSIVKTMLKNVSRIK